MTNTKPPNTQSPPPPNTNEIPPGVEGIGIARRGDWRPVVRIEINFPVPVVLPAGFERELDGLVNKACQHYESLNPDRVMWPAGHGSKILWREPEEPDFDPSIYEISVSERERYESERGGERLDERMRREKLESAIAWFGGDEKPNARRVSRGDLLAMLQELQRLRN